MYFFFIWHRAYNANWSNRSSTKSISMSVLSIHNTFALTLIWFLRLSQQFFSYVGLGLPGLDQYYASKVLRLMCLAQRHNAVTPVRLEPTTPWSRVKIFTTQPLLSQHFVYLTHTCAFIKIVRFNKSLFKMSEFWQSLEKVQCTLVNSWCYNQSRRFTFLYRVFKDYPCWNKLFKPRHEISNNVAFWHNWLRRACAASF